jgi:DNA-binding NtrC family response regulator
MEINSKADDEITVSVKFPMNLSEVLEHFQTTILSKAMEKFHGNRSQAAKALGLNRCTLISKAKRHGIISESAEE